MPPGGNHPQLQHQRWEELGCVVIIDVGCDLVMMDLEPMSRASPSVLLQLEEVPAHPAPDVFKAGDEGGGGIAAVILEEMYTCHHHSNENRPHGDGGVYGVNFGGAEIIFTLLRVLMWMVGSSTETAMLLGRRQLCVLAQSLLCQLILPLMKLAKKFKQLQFSLPYNDNPKIYPGSHPVTSAFFLLRIVMGFFSFQLTDVSFSQLCSQELKPTT